VLCFFYFSYARLFQVNHPPMPPTIAPSKSFSAPRYFLSFLIDPFFNLLGYPSIWLIVFYRGGTDSCPLAPPDRFSAPITCRFFSSFWVSAVLESRFLPPLDPPLNAVQGTPSCTISPLVLPHHSLIFSRNLSRLSLTFPKRSSRPSPLIVSSSVIHYFCQMFLRKLMLVLSSSAFHCFPRLVRLFKNSQRSADEVICHSLPWFPTCFVRKARLISDSSFLDSFPLVFNFLSRAEGSLRALVPA